MLLGSIIANLSDETSILEMLVSLDDLVLMARMREGAAEAGESLAASQVQPWDRLSRAPTTLPGCP